MSSTPLQTPINWTIWQKPYICYQSRLQRWTEPYTTQLRSTPQQNTCVEHPEANTRMNWTLWQIAIAVTAVYGVNHTAHSYEAPHSKMLCGYPCVKYPIANTYELHLMADSHSYQSSVWSEPYGTQLRSTPHQNAMGLSLSSNP